jgi:hypothetical protein
MTKKILINASYNDKLEFAEFLSELAKRTYADGWNIGLNVEPADPTDMVWASDVSVSLKHVWNERALELLMNEVGCVCDAFTSDGFSTDFTIV